MGWTTERARVAALARRRDDTDPQLVEARRDLRAVRLEEHVRRVAHQVPPLTDEQCDRIAAALRPVRAATA